MPPPVAVVENIVLKEKPAPEPVALVFDNQPPLVLPEAPAASADLKFGVEPDPVIAFDIAPPLPVLQVAPEIPPATAELAKTADKAGDRNETAALATPGGLLVQNPLGDPAGGPGIAKLEMQKTHYEYDPDLDAAQASITEVEEPAPVLKTEPVIPTSKLATNAWAANEQSFSFAE